jgi:hypothetical protein
MPTLISQPTRIQAAGNKPKLIDEFIGRVNWNTAAMEMRLQPLRLATLNVPAVCSKRNRRTQPSAS